MISDTNKPLPSAPSHPVSPLTSLIIPICTLNWGIPKETVIGLSKINRLVGFFAQRPQVQERLTQQVMVAIQALTGTQDVAVSINATHYCVKARGVKDSQSSTKTSSLGGAFNNNPDLRREFYQS